MADLEKDLCISNTVQEQTTASDASIDSNDRRKTARKDLVVVAAPLRIEESPPTLASLWKRRQKPDPNAVATQPSVYDDPEQAKYFQPLPTYENLHRFDPNERWTWAEEHNVLKKIEWRVAAWAAIAFFALDLDRSNISQANTDNFLDDLGLTTNDYNLGNTVFKTAFLLAELPSQLISKKIGPDRWIPAQMILWSIVAASQFWLRGRKSFLATRALLALLQGGFIPDVILYMSYFYKSTELPFRLAIFWMANRLTDVVAPLLAYGLLRLRDYHGYEGWRWLFLIEGMLTLAIGVWSIFMMAPSPTQTKAWWRPKGWFSEREEKIMVNRILRDDPSKGDMHNRQAITFSLLWKSLCDFDLWPIYALGITFGIPAGPSDQYLTLTLRQLGFDTFNSNLLSIPAQIGTTVNMLVFTYISEKINQRSLMGIFVQIWFLPCLVAMAVIPDSSSRWSRYALVTVLLSYPSPHPMQVGWCSRNSNTVRTRTVSAALYNMSVQVQAIIYSNIYQDDDKPLYRRGNKVLVGICVLNIFIYAFNKMYYIWRNKQRDRKWNALTAEEKVEYLDTTTQEGSKRLDFRFAH
ncbi:MFS general substrate transporter [Paraphaeosphaeria sporulosa]|uniref:MFS general substrate transporter n=1 Tax=Paraphaeosphaeria sporulosa TaxID=1460663 RepID=A0A177CZW8_9PLEO|nr:MFS general substrate transporter [Paraphaeosphaeria sporulosa]OAG12462.1 MFS general substrate transporter [Paraphaeosphaeria sporulosa]